MHMLWPSSLYLLALIPLLIAAYIWILQRRRRYAVRFSSLSLVRQALPRSTRWRRHVPFALFLLSLSALIGAMARPAAEVGIPSNQSTIMLAIDVSRSMCSMDIQPNRLQAAKQAALSFINDQDSSTRIGIVAFSGFAELIQAPTADKGLLRNAIKSLTTDRRTAIGGGLLKSIEGLAEFDKNIAPLGTNNPQIDPNPDGVIPVTGQYAPAIIVLLTDGVSNSGPVPLEAAKEAVARGLRVYTIGFGTDHPGLLPDCNASGPSFFRPKNDFTGSGFFRGIDEQTLKDISSMTGGKYYAASSAGELQKVFSDLPTDHITTREQMEISAFFAAAGAVLAFLAILLSSLFHPFA